MRMPFRMAAAAVAMSVLLMGPAHAGQVRIEMLNKAGDQRFVYAPDLIRVQPGDTLVLVPTDKGHNAVSIDGMLPDGAEPIHVGFNKEGTVRFERPGIYGIKCTPHVGLGMVSLVVVGDVANSDAVRRAAAKLPPKARERIAALLGQTDS